MAEANVNVSPEPDPTAVVMSACNEYVTQQQLQQRKAAAAETSSDTSTATTTTTATATTNIKGSSRGRTKQANKLLSNNTAKRGGSISIRVASGLCAECGHADTSHDSLDLAAVVRLRKRGKRDGLPCQHGECDCDKFDGGRRRGSNRRCGNCRHGEQSHRLATTRDKALAVARQAASETPCAVVTCSCGGFDGGRDECRCCYHSLSFHRPMTVVECAVRATLQRAARFACRSITDSSGNSTDPCTATTSLGNAALENSGLGSGPAAFETDGSLHSDHHSLGSTTGTTGSLTSGLPHGPVTQSTPSGPLVDLDDSDYEDVNTVLCSCTAFVCGDPTELMDSLSRLLSSAPSSEVATAPAAAAVPTQDVATTTTTAAATTTAGGKRGVGSRRSKRNTGAKANVSNTNSNESTSSKGRRKRSSASGTGGAESSEVTELAATVSVRSGGDSPVNDADQGLLPEQLELLHSYKCANCGHSLRCHREPTNDDLLEDERRVRGRSTLLRSTVFESVGKQVGSGLFTLVQTYEDFLAGAATDPEEPQAVAAAVCGTNLRVWCSYPTDSEELAATPPTSVSFQLNGGGASGSPGEAVGGGPASGDDIDFWGTAGGGTPSDSDVDMFDEGENPVNKSGRARRSSRSATARGPAQRGDSLRLELQKRERQAQEQLLQEQQRKAWDMKRRFAYDAMLRGGDFMDGHGVAFVKPIKPRCIAWDPVSTHIFAGFSSGAVRVFKTKPFYAFSSISYNLQKNDKFNLSPANCLATHPRLPLLVVGHQDGTLVLWVTGVADSRPNKKGSVGVEEGELTGAGCHQHGVVLHSSKWTKVDGGYAACGPRVSAVCPPAPGRSSTAVTTASFSPCGRALAVGTADSQVFVYSLTVPGEPAAPTSGRGAKAASAIRVASETAASLRLVHATSVGFGTFTCSAWSADSSYFLVGGESDSAFLFCLAYGKDRGVGDSGAACGSGESSMSWSRSRIGGSTGGSAENGSDSESGEDGGSRSGGSSGGGKRQPTVRVLAELVGHTSFVTGVGFLPSSRTAVTSSLDGTLLYWNVGRVRSSSPPSSPPRGRRGFRVRRRSRPVGTLDSAPAGSPTVSYPTVGNALSGTLPAGGISTSPHPATTTAATTAVGTSTAGSTAVVPVEDIIESVKPSAVHEVGSCVRQLYCFGPYVFIYVADLGDRLVQVIRPPVSLI